MIGAGVSGLTTAVCLAEAGASVAIHAAEPPARTTSVAAGAVWGPHLVGADTRVPAWAAVTLDQFRELSGAQPSVHMASGTAAARDADAEPPEFAADTASLTPVAAGHLPAGYKSAWRLAAPLVSMPDYLAYLLERYLHAGGRPVEAVTYPALGAATAAAV